MNMDLDRFTQDMSNRFGAGGAEAAHFSGLAGDSDNYGQLNMIEERRIAGGMHGSDTESDESDEMSGTGRAMEDMDDSTRIRNNFHLL
jgi:hypothetical protein